MAEQVRVLGVYSKTKQQQSGIGATSRSQEQKTYWFVRRLDDERYEIQPLNGQHVPSGLCSVISKGDFMVGYLPELDFYEHKTAPALKSLEKKLAKGEAFFAEQQFDDAEKEFTKALLIDEKNPQATIRLGEVHCRKNDYHKLKGVLKRILNNDAVFAEAERHRFNEFGINLRKSKFFQESIQYYSRVLQVNDQDENLHFNIARVYFDMEKVDECLQHIRNALEIKPDFKEAGLFLDHCQDPDVDVQDLLSELDAKSPSAPS
jgi:tetratricopeptide (TPR) repeat protein